MFRCLPMLLCLPVRESNRAGTSVGTKGEPRSGIMDGLHRLSGATGRSSPRECTCMRGCAWLRGGALLMLAMMMPMTVLAQEEPAAPAALSTDEEDATDRGIELFDGKELGDWKPTNFGGEGEVVVEDGSLVLRPGSPLTGVTWDGELPEGSDYELSLEVKKTRGIDFFCALTFPVKKSHCSFIVGGWAGSVVGLSCLDGDDASRNDTTRYMSFEKDRWYKIRVRVSDERIQAWIDDEQVVDRDISETEVSLRAEVLLSRPLGLCSFETEAHYRNLRWTPLNEEKPE